MSSRQTGDRIDIYQRITERIVVDLEKGVRPWVQPWRSGYAAGRITRPLRHNGEPYSGMNVLLLWSEAVARGYGASIWMTFRQAVELGAHVRKAEGGAMVVFASRFARTDTDAAGDEVERDIPFLKTYSVFNVEQIEGLPEHYYHRPTPVIDPIERIEHADRFFANTRAVIRHGGSQAYYAPAGDFIQMPAFENFRDAVSYITVLAHESVHNADIRIMPNCWRRGFFGR
jgi:antirestriction protein ArdC